MLMVLCGRFDFQADFSQEAKLIRVLAMCHRAHHRVGPTQSHQNTRGGSYDKQVRAIIFFNKRMSHTLSFYTVAPDAITQTTDRYFNFINVINP